MSTTADTSNKVELIEYLETTSGINNILRNKLLATLSDEYQGENQMHTFRTLVLYPRMGHLEPAVQETLKAFIAREESLNA